MTMSTCTVIETMLPGAVGGLVNGGQTRADGIRARWGERGFKGDGGLVRHKGVLWQVVKCLPIASRQSAPRWYLLQ